MQWIKCETVTCLSYFNANPEYRDELIISLLLLIPPTRAEPGCLQYELIEDNTKPNFFIMVEKFINHKALEEHENKAYIVDFVKNKMNSLCEKVTWHVGCEIVDSPKCSTAE